MSLELLDEKGFVFLDAANRPYLCRMFGGEPWLFYWHPNKIFVSLRKINQSEIWRLPQNLTENQQETYLKLNIEKTQLVSNPYKLI